MLQNITKFSKQQIKDNIKKLLVLQEIRQNLDYLNKEINVIKKDLEKEESKYESRKFQYNKNLPFLEKTEKEYREITEEIANIKRRVEKCEEKKKKIKTIKEFKALNKEIDNLSQENGIKENQLLDKSESLEYKREKMKKLEDSLKEIENNLKAKQEELEESVKERKNSIKKEMQKKDKIEKEIDSGLINIFNRIYKNNELTALAKVQNFCCTGCYAIIPKQTAVNVKKSEDFVFCPSCSRILYYDSEQD